MKLNKTIYVLSMAGMLGLWACTSDEAMPDRNIASGERVPITIEVSHGGDVQTRTDLSEDLQEGGLTHTWTAGDEVVFYNSKGEEAGKLTLQEGEGTSKGIFTGTVTAESGKYHLWYFGRPQAAADASSADRYPYLDFDAGKVTLNFANQNFKSVDDLTAVDVLSQDVDIIVKGGKGYVEKSIFMNPHVAMAKFKVSGLPEGTTGTLKILNKLTSINTSGNKVYQIYYKHPMLLSGSGGNAGGNSTTSNGFSYENVTNGSDIYVAFIPNAYELIFEFTSNTGNKYSYTFGNNNIEAGVYYQSFTEGENGNDGKSDGISIPLQPDNNEVKLVYHANFEGANPAIYEETMSSTSGQATFTVKSYQQLIKDKKLPSRDNYISFGWSKTENGDIEDLSTIEANGNESTIDLYAVWTDQSKNPLIKWAEANLLCDKNSLTSSLASSEKASGSLYQWGRNIGFASYSDARGTSREVNGRKYLDYYIVGLNKTGSGSYVNYHAGTSTVPFVNGNNQIDMETIFGFETVNQLKTLTKKWVMNADVYERNGGDYWIWSGGGSNWSERAIAGGYSDKTPCPKGYRLPTVSEFQEILPSEEISSNSSLSSLLNDKVEIKNNKNCTYAIKWKKEVSGIEIKCMVVPKNFNSDNLSSIDWDSENNKNVQRRFFPFTGAIRSVVIEDIPANPYVFNSAWYYSATLLPLGDVIIQEKDVRFSNAGRCWWAYWLIKNDFSNLYGAYWTSDDKQTFTFVENSGWNTIGSETQKSQFKMTTQQAHNGYAIRCVIDENAK